MLFWMMMACNGQTKDTSVVEPQARLLSAEIRLLAVINAAPLDEVEVTSDWEDSTALTDESGTAALPVLSNDSYQLRASSGDLEHIYQGQSGEEDFLIVAFLADRSITTQVYDLLNSSNPGLGLSYDSSKGIMVVAMDTPSLRPAVGARAELSVNGEDINESFIFGAAYPELGNTLISGGKSFVFFPNVAAGAAEITVTGAEGSSCRSAPGGMTNGRFSATVEADAVTVAVFVCE